MSAVDQGYRYAINLPCDWIIVTSIRQTRLYCKGTDQQTYERFDTEELADSDALLKRFVFLLGAARVVPETGRCHFYELLAESERVGKELTKEFYLRYADMRQDAFQRLCRDNPDVPRHDVLRCAQKLLDRVLFCAFCEDRGLLPTETIRKAYEHRDPYHPRPIWDNFRGLFRAINRGNAALGIHAYNGGLFADDPVLDRLKVADEVCAYFRELGDFDYRPAHQAAAYAPASRQQQPDRRGHSGPHLRAVDHRPGEAAQRVGRRWPTPAGRRRRDSAQEPAARRKARSTPPPSSPATSSSRRWAGCCGTVSSNFGRPTSRRPRARPAPRWPIRGSTTLDKLKKPERAALVRFWEAWQDELAAVRLLDPACGSGAFLIEAFDQLHAAYQASNDRLEELRGHRTLFDLDKRILENNLYGVDLNEEAIEICRLSLWIKTAERGKALTSLDHTIRVGNSIVADPAVLPRRSTGRPRSRRSSSKGGFDVVVANPPYVRQELLSPIKPYLESAYRVLSRHGRPLRLLLRTGHPAAEAGRAALLRRHQQVDEVRLCASRCGGSFRRKRGFESVVDFGHAKQIFEEVDVFPSIIVARRPTDAPKPDTARLCTIPREQLRIDDLSRQIEQEGVELPLSQLRADAWQLEPGGRQRTVGKDQGERRPTCRVRGGEAVSRHNDGLQRSLPD